MEMIPIIAILSSFSAAVLIVYFITRAKQRRVELQTEMQSRLIDRFGSGPELSEFLQSPAGKQFVGSVQAAPAVMTRERILGGFTRSIVLTALGAAFMFLTFWDRDDDWVVPAAILLFLGLGYFIATLLSYKLSKRIDTDVLPRVQNGDTNRV
jgi:hypothetical protein